MSQKKEITIECDPVTGLCQLPDFEAEANLQTWNDDEDIFYIGDPMCSWCWGISPHVNALKRFANQEHIKMKLIMGGLRPGGGQKWDEQFKSYLKHHWQEVNNRSGQPFKLALFQKDQYDYDTEPACRAVVTIRNIAPEKDMAFYELVQYYFYAENKDPKLLDFYRPICEKLEIDFKDFTENFKSKAMLEATQADFLKSREMGIRGFPSLIYRKGDKLYMIASGYVEFNDLKESISKLRSE